MKTWRGYLTVLAGAAFLALGQAARGDQDFFDTLDDHLKFSAFGGNVTGRFSGLLDLEGYFLPQPPPGLITSNSNALFTPRLTQFLDVQLGSHFYLFEQARVDRGFDPADQDVEVRLDEYALRYSPWDDQRLNIQVGKFATVIGAWGDRDGSWTNPFITAPLPYENPTAIIADEAPSSHADFHSMRYNLQDRSEQIPLIWGPAYTAGASVSGHIGKFDYAAEVKNASQSSDPEYWDPTSFGWDHPTVGGRIGVRPDESLNSGASASVGPYLSPDVVNLPPGKGIGDYDEFLIGQDVSYAWHHLQLWAECFETRFQVPNVGDADTVAYYIEAKYKFTPQLFGALRWNQQLYNNLPDGAGGSSAWGNDIGKVDVAVTYRFTPHVQAKVQYSFLNQDLPAFENQHFLAAQLTVRF